MQVSQAALEQKLRTILEQLVQQGLKLSPDMKNQVVKQIASDILDPKSGIELSADQLNNKNVEALFKIAIVSESTPQQKNMPRLDWRLLFKRETLLKDKDELKEQLLPMLQLLFTAKRDNKELTQKELDRLDELAEKLEKALTAKTRQDRDATNDFNLMFYLLTQLVINLYGGDKEKFTLTDDIGEENLAHGEGDSLEAARSSADYGREDPLGIIIKNIFNLLSAGVFNKEFEDAVEDLDIPHSAPSPFDIHKGPKLPGME